MFGKITLKIVGLNQSRLIENLIAWNIKIYYLNKLSSSQLIIVTNQTSCKNLFGKLKNMCYTINVEKVTGLLAFCNLFKRHIALFVMLLLMTAMVLVTSQFIFRIDVYGIDRIDKSQVVSVLETNGVKVGQYNKNINTKEIEKALYSTIDDIGLVSVIIKGTTVVVNIEEKLEFENKNFTPIVAQEDGIITDIVLVTGTPLVKVGEVVKKGDVLIAPYYIDGQGQQKAITPVAEVYATTEAVGSIDIKDKEVINSRTGKEYSHNSFILFGQEFFSSNSCPFDLYEVEYNDTYVASNSLLPLIKRTTIYYEIESKIIDIDYQEKREEAIVLATDKAYESLQNQSLQILDKKIVESQYDEGTIVTCYLKVNIRLDI